MAPITAIAAAGATQAAANDIVTELHAIGIKKIQEIEEAVPVHEMCQRLPLMGSVLSKEFRAGYGFYCSHQENVQLTLRFMELFKTIHGENLFPRAQNE